MKDTIQDYSVEIVRGESTPAEIPLHPLSGDILTKKQEIHDNDIDTISIQGDNFQQLSALEEQRPIATDEEAAVVSQEQAHEQRELRDQTNLLPFKQLLVVCLGLSCALFCSLLDQTIVSTALPTLGKVFHDAGISSWVGTSYLLTSTACQPLFGRLSDIFGRKYILLGSMGFFLLGSILCAVSQSMIMLICCRAIAGIGGGGIMTMVMISVSDLVSLQKRGKYQGFMAVIVAAATSLGPILGGVFTEKVSWRWCFYINIPLTSIAMVIVFLVLPMKELPGSTKAKLKQIDYRGCALAFTSIVLITIPLTWGGTIYSWDSAPVVAPLVLGLLIFLCFLFVEIKMASLPLIPMYIFRNRTVIGAATSTFLSGIGTYGTIFYLPQFYQIVRNDSSLTSGILLLPLILSQIISSLAAGFIVSKVGKYKAVLCLGFTFWTVSCGLFSTIAPSTDNSHMVGYQILAGCGAGLTLQTGLVAMQAAVERKDMATATGARNFLRMLGGTVALAMCAAILNNTAKEKLSETFGPSVVASIIADPTQIRSMGFTADQESAIILSFTQGIANVFYLLISCCGMSFFLILFLVKDYPLTRKDDARLEADAKDGIVAAKKKNNGG